MTLLCSKLVKALRLNLAFKACPVHPPAAPPARQQHSPTRLPLLAVPFTAAAQGTPAHPSKPSSNITFFGKSRPCNPQQCRSFKKYFLMLGTKTSEKTLFLPSGSPSVSLVETDTLFICKLTDLSTSDSNKGHHSCAPSVEQGICTSLAWPRCFGRVSLQKCPLA